MGNLQHDRRGSASPRLPRRRHRRHHPPTADPAAAPLRPVVARPSQPRQAQRRIVESLLQLLRRPVRGHGLARRPHSARAARTRTCWPTTPTPSRPAMEDGRPWRASPPSAASAPSPASDAAFTRSSTPSSATTFRAWRPPRARTPSRRCLPPPSSPRPSRQATPPALRAALPGASATIAIPSALRARGTTFCPSAPAPRKGCLPPTAGRARRRAWPWPGPKTPHTSDVTPWEFQPDPTDPPLPLLPGQAPPSRSGAQKAPLSITHPHHHHNILHFPVHRHTRSREGGLAPSLRSPRTSLPLRPTLSREESSNSFRRTERFPRPDTEQDVDVES